MASSQTVRVQFHAYFIAACGIDCQFLSDYLKNRAIWN
jgi:hypothetical protein